MGLASVEIQRSVVAGSNGEVAAASASDALWSVSLPVSGSASCFFVFEASAVSQKALLSPSMQSVEVCLQLVRRREALSKAWELVQVACGRQVCTGSKQPSASVAFLGVPLSRFWTSKCVWWFSTILKDFTLFHVCHSHRHALLSWRLEINIATFGTLPPWYFDQPARGIVPI